MRQSASDNETKQRQLEDRMRELGIARFRDQWDNAVKRGDVADQKPVKRLTDHYTGLLSIHIAEAVKAATRGKAGRQSVAMGALKGVDTDLLAYLTCRYVMNAVAMHYPLTSTTIELGRALEDELMLRSAAKHNRGSSKWVEREVKRRKISSKRMQKEFHVKVSKYKGHEWDRWSKDKRWQVGTALIHMFAEATRLVDILNIKRGRKFVKEMRPSINLMQWIDASKADLEILTPFRTPMIVPPKPWTTPTNGGYLNTRMAILAMGGILYQVDSAASKVRVAQLGEVDMREVYKAIGYLDCTKYKINTRVLEVLRNHYDNSRGVGSLLSYAEVDVPKYPKKAKEDKALHKKWLKDARNAHDTNNLTRMAKFETTRLVNMAEDWSTYEGLYFPHQIDFRGRAYPMPICLNPQGPDHVRALLHFAEGKHVTDDKAMEWLMIHGANCWGYDKCTMDERIAWVRDNSKLIAETYHDPYGNTEWHKADKPWSFLAWCYDFIDVIEHGKPSYVRVAMDGSCNGLQHFSAMTRDPIGAKAVNLASNEKPNDIYQTVADRVKVKLKSVSNEQRWMADTWLALGIDRKLTKRSVMVMPYGGTRHSTMEYLDEALTDKLKGANNPFGDDKAKAVAFLATMVYDATREVVIGGKVVMDWLQTIVKVASDANVHLKWTTPHGMLVQQHYTVWKSREVETYLNGKGSVRTTVQLSEDTGVLSGKLSVNGISPNFVHSLDACALMRTVNHAAKKGVTHFHMIHDDYGTHAADTQVLADTLRKAFVEMYEKHDVLLAFRNEVLAQLPSEAQKLIPKVPKRGAFNLKEVLKSEFFFA